MFFLPKYIKLICRGVFLHAFAYGSAGNYGYCRGLKFHMLVDLWKK